MFRVTQDKIEILDIEGNVNERLNLHEVASDPATLLQWCVLFQLIELNQRVGSVDSATGTGTGLMGYMAQTAGSLQKVLSMSQGGGTDGMDSAVASALNAFQAATGMNLSDLAKGQGKGN